MRHGGPARVLRGLAAAVLTTLLALCFHIVGGGTAPGPLALAIAFAGVAWATLLIGRARPSLPLLVVAVAVAQLVLHTAFSISTGTAVLTGLEHAGHADGGLVLAGTHSGQAMWIAHILAGVLTVVGIRRGEHAMRGLLAVVRVVARTLVRGIVAVLAGALDMPASRRPPAERSSTGELVIAPGIGSVVVRRGPPALAA